MRPLGRWSAPGVGGGERRRKPPSWSTGRRSRRRVGSAERAGLRQDRPGGRRRRLAAAFGAAVAGTAGAALLAGGPAAGGQAPEAAPSAPRALYVTACSSCHGADGQGNPQIDAPALAGLSATYLQRQVDGFRNGYRGLHPDDREGAEMRPMIEGFADADLAALGAWLASLPLPPPTAPASAGGDPDRGRGPYAACAVCHGRSGEGNDALGAPRLAGQASWYTARQLRKFMDGVRGSHPDDTSGASMRASVANLDPRDVPHIVAWIETLPQPAPGE